MTKPAMLTKPLNNRVIGSGIEQVDQLIANPDNWRIHPGSQQQALAGAIDDIGYIRSVTVNKRTGHVVDGHARITLALRSGVKELPVEYVDLSEDEEAKALLTLDPIAAMAAADREKLDDLLRQTQSDDARMVALLADIAAREGLYESVPEPGDAATETISENWAIMIDCKDERQQTELLTRLTKEGYQCRALIL